METIQLTRLLSETNLYIRWGKSAVERASIHKTSPGSKESLSKVLYVTGTYAGYIVILYRVLGPNIRRWGENPLYKEKKVNLFVIRSFSKMRLTEWIKDPFVMNSRLRCIKGWYFFRFATNGGILWKFKEIIVRNLIVILPYVCTYNMSEGTYRVDLNASVKFWFISRNSGARCECNCFFGVNKAGCIVNSARAKWPFTTCGSRQLLQRLQLYQTMHKCKVIE